MANDDSFGISVANVGDLDGGGGTVIAVGAHRDDTGGTGRGALYLLSYDAGGALTATTKIAHGNPSSLSLSNEGEFGVSVANVGDLDGGGGTVVAVGAWADNTGRHRSRRALSAVVQRRRRAHGND